MFTTSNITSQSAEAAYIINQNQKLEHTGKEQRDKIGELTESNKELEEELDRREPQITYMRGLLKNFIAIDELQKEIYKQQNQYHTEMMKLRTMTRQRERRVFAYLFFALSLLFPVTLLPFSLVNVSLAVCFYSSVFGFLYTSFAKYANSPVFSRQEERAIERMSVVVAKVKELKDLRISCDFLNEYVDNL